MILGTAIDGQILNEVFDTRNIPTIERLKKNRAVGRVHEIRKNEASRQQLAAELAGAEPQSPEHCGARELH
jgi:hypothetical protein